MKLRLIWNENLPNLLSAMSRRPRRRRVLGALESLEARVNLSAILVVETTNAYWVIEDPTYGAAANHGDNGNTDNGNTDAENSDDGDGGSDNLDVLPNAGTALMVSPSGGLAHADKETQSEDAATGSATTNDTSGSLGQDEAATSQVGSGVQARNALVSNVGTASGKNTTDASDTNALLNQLLANAGITADDVVSVRLLPNTSLEDLIQSENDNSGDSAGDNTADNTGSDNVTANSNSAHTTRNTTSTASTSSSVPAANSISATVRADAPKDQSAEKPQQSAATSSASSVVAWLRTYFQETNTKSAAESDGSEPRNADAIDPRENVRVAVMKAAFPQVAAVSAVVANVDQLFAKFQMELADDTGSVSALRYVRTTVTAVDSEEGSDTTVVAGVGFDLSYSQWASLASVIGLATGVWAKQAPRESRDENRLPPFRARSATKLRVACVTE